MVNSEHKIEELESVEKKYDSIEEEKIEHKPVAEQKPEAGLETQFEKEQKETQLEAEKESAQIKATSKVGASSQVRLNDYKKMSRQNQVKMLCQLAFEQGLDEAVKTAKSLDNAYVLDEFHDTLIDELYKRLISENKLKKL